MINPISETLLSSRCHCIPHDSIPNNTLLHVMQKYANPSKRSSWVQSQIQWHSSIHPSQYPSISIMIKRHIIVPATPRRWRYWDPESWTSGVSRPCDRWYTAQVLVRTWPWQADDDWHVATRERSSCPRFYLRCCYAFGWPLGESLADVSCGSAAWQDHNRLRRTGSVWSPERRTHRCRPARYPVGVFFFKREREIWVYGGFTGQLGRKWCGFLKKWVAWF